MVATLMPAHAQESAKSTSSSGFSNLQSHAALQTSVLKFLQNHSGTAPDSRIEITPLDAQLQLQACRDLSTYIPSNPSKIIGNVRVSVRCQSPSTWLVVFNAKVHSLQKYLTWNQDMQAGSTLTGHEFSETSTWSDQLPTGALSDGRTLIGKTLKHNVTAGTIATVSMVKAEFVISAGQSVKITINGDGFKISTEGKALASAVAGQSVQVKMATGQVVSGLASAGGVVEVTK